MVKEGDFVAVFHSIHRVMQAEKLLKSKRLDMLLIPAPRILGADCGLAIRFGRGVRSEVLEALEAEGLRPEDLYVKLGEEYRRISEAE